ncbi:Serine hydrolase [Halomicronema hongdechloris C2206]|uniref:Serine hydrolase n=2 Tax=Halomicronema hongdechloris TaxID=1209493 RepID=A0A1Z3HP37_9CYAN|nr:Serine hydrolase [Halomicronema hongdechloris C2206]
MRLLILGIGVAAIVGTVLSVLGPTEADAPTPGALTQAEPERSQSSSNPRANSGLSWNTELTYLAADLESLSALTPGLTQATFMVDLDTGDYVDVNGSTPVPAASTIKVPILVALLQAIDAGQVTLDQGLTLRQQDLAGGSGELREQPLDTQYPVLEVATQMIVSSDNTATNMIIELLGGATALNQQFRQWGLSATVIRSPLPDLGGTNTTSAQDLVTLMARVNQGELLSLRSRDRLLAIMQRTDNRSLIPSAAGNGAIVANKTGDIKSLLGDVALVDTRSGKRYALAILVQRPDNDGRAGELIRRITERVQQEMTQAVSTTETTVPEEARDATGDTRFDGEATPSLSPGDGTDLQVPQG